RRVVGAVQLHHRAGLLVLYHPLALDEIRVAEPDFTARGQPEELLGRVLHEVFLLDVNYPGERQLARAGTRVFRIVDGLQLFHLAFRIVIDAHRQGRAPGRDAGAPPVQVFADAVLQPGHFDGARELGHADTLAQVADRFRRVAAPPHAAQGRHARV